MHFITKYFNCEYVLRRTVKACVLLQFRPRQLDPLFNEYRCRCYHRRLLSCRHGSRNLERVWTMKSTHFRPVEVGASQLLDFELRFLIHDSFLFTEFLFTVEAISRVLKSHRDFEFLPPTQSFFPRQFFTAFSNFDPHHNRYLVPYNQA